MASGLVRHPWRAYAVLATAFFLTLAGTWAGPLLAEQIRDGLWKWFRIDLFGNYAIVKSWEPFLLLHFTLVYTFKYLLPFGVVVLVLTRNLPTWFSIVLGVMMSFIIASYTLLTEYEYYGIRRTLSAYCSAQISCAAGVLCCWLYRQCVSVPRPNTHGED